MVPVVYTFFFALAVISALLVVFSRHAVYSALFLVVTMISIAGIFILINAQLAAFLQIIVYAGAIMVLFLFVIMLLNLGVSPELPMKTRFIRRAGAAMLATLLVQLIILGVKYSGAESAHFELNETATINDVALNLLTRYLYAFEMTSIMILVAVIGAMALARKSILREPERSDDGNPLPR
ncbi:NADH-quinone oxidoreductase subunit J [Candidatus Sumerlaeota bacterium]|nr:NADH-quinone oxidoreductase subunit J [Candidatus Sumerlaeota bacterium]